MLGRVSNVSHFYFKLQRILISDGAVLSRNVHSFPSKVCSNSLVNGGYIPSSTINTSDLIFLNHKNENFSLVNSVPLPKINILDRPLPFNGKIITDLPFSRINVTYEEIIPEKIIEEPEQNNIVEKHAVRMIVIRKRKMRVHKRKKLRKKMKFIWEKVQRRRKVQKEKLFQAELLAKIKEADKFDAAVYVKEKIQRADEEIIPKLWHGKRLPEFVIRELQERSKQKMEWVNAKKERRKNMNLNASDYK